MHETALMQNLMATVTQVAEEHAVARVRRVAISVGKFANVLPDALVFAFKALTQEGIMKGAVLEINYLPARARCDLCGYEYEAVGFPIVCPACQSKAFAIIGGEEVYIDSIDCEEKNLDCGGK
ncbi:MAG: hydrogenase maturation nickel metallochaperone HypA [Dethiobacteria bacterium]|jgi:hydrogenase nickel incorporation protein HypA/HybF